MDADRLLFLETLVEVLALEHLRDGELGGEADEGFEVELEQPLGVVADFGLLPVENFEDLRLVGFGVGVELAAGERRTGGVASRGIADESGAVADEEDDGVAESWKCLSLRMRTVWPRWRSGAVGSKPALMRSGLPLARTFRGARGDRSHG